MSYTFTYSDDDDNDTTVMLTKNSEDAVWPDLADMFFQYLQGVGYVLTREDLGQYYIKDTSVLYSAAEEDKYILDKPFDYISEELQSD